MQPDPAFNSPEVQSILDLLHARIRAVLGTKLLGLYVVGSLVTGDFDFRSSDIDLIATLASDPDDAEIQRLDAMHSDIARQRPFWKDRIEIIYITQARLSGDRADYVFPITSPGEPFHIRDVHHEDWATNWYVLREGSIALRGDDPKNFVAPVSPEALARNVREMSRSTLEWLTPDHQLGSQSYAILTLCRALCLVQTGAFVSKKQAAAWVAEQFPQWADLLDRALVWRAAGANQMPGHIEQFPETYEFVVFMIEQIG